MTKDKDAKYIPPNETDAQKATREAQEAAVAQNAAILQSRESGPFRRVRATQPVYVNEAYHSVGDVFDVAEADFNEAGMEEVDPETLTSRGEPARAPARQYPESGGREKGVESDNLTPDLDPENRDGGKKKR